LGGVYPGEGVTRVVWTHDLYLTKVFQYGGRVSKSPSRHRWLEKYPKQINGEKTIPVRLLYAKKYSHILMTGYAQELLTISNTKRENAMKSLALLSKYWGCYARWKEIKERYQLKWSNDNGMQVFNEICGGQNNYRAMTTWLSTTCRELPDGLSNILRFNVFDWAQAK
jgi:hypothetical protein